MNSVETRKTTKKTKKRKTKKNKKKKNRRIEKRLPKYCYCGNGDGGGGCYSCFVHLYSHICTYVALLFDEVGIMRKVNGKKIIINNEMMSIVDYEYHKK